MEVKQHFVATGGQTTTLTTFLGWFLYHTNTPSQTEAVRHCGPFETVMVIKGYTNKIELN